MEPIIISSTCRIIYEHTTGGEISRERIEIHVREEGNIHTERGEEQRRVFGGSVITKRNVLFRGSVDLSRRWMNEWMHHGATYMFRDERDEVNAEIYGQGMSRKSILLTEKWNGC